MVRTLIAHAKGPGFDSLITQHIHRLISQANTQEVACWLSNDVLTFDLGPF